MQKHWKRSILRAVAAVMLLLCVVTIAFAQDVSIAKDSTTATITAYDQTLYCKPTQTQAIIGNTRDNYSKENAGITTLWNSETRKLTLKADSSTYYTSKFIFITTYYYAQDTVNTVTLTNNTDSTMKLSYIASGLIDGNGTFSEADGTHKTLAPGATLSFSVRSKASSDTVKTSAQGVGTVEITGITVVQDPKIKFASSTRGDYKYQINTGTEVSVAKGTKISDEIAVAMNSTVTLTSVSADSDYTFYGWMGDGKLLGKTNPGSYTIQEDMTIYPVYLKNSEISAGAPFSVTVSGTRTNYMLWQEAMEASLAAKQPVVLNRNYTLPTDPEDAGLCTDFTKANYVAVTADKLTYTVPYGAGFLIPFNDTTTTIRSGDFTDAPAITSSTAKPTIFLTLTLKTGTNINVIGTMSVDGQQCWAMGNNGCPTGAQAKVILSKDSSITVANGGKLYAWGFIARAAKDNEGTVVAQNGATVYENFQVKDWRGGNGTTAMNGNSWRVLPVSQYYVQNIEVPLKLEWGASEMVYMSVEVSGYDGHAAAPFVGGNGLFRFTSGTADGSYFIKDYDEENDRQLYTVKGKISLASFALDVVMHDIIGSLTAIMGINTNINTASYVLPLNNNITVTCLTDSTFVVNNDVAILPGVEIYVQSNATIKLASGLSCYVYNKESWCPETHGYVGAGNNYLAPLAYVSTGNAPTYTRTKDILADAKIVVNGEVDASGAYLYTTTGSSMIVSDGGGVVKTTAGTQTVTYQAVQSGNEVAKAVYVEGESSSGYAEIPVEPAVLKNGDGTYVHSTTDTYTYIDGKWICEKHSSENQAEVPATCTDPGRTAGTKCTVCGSVLSGMEEIPAAGHTEGEVVVENNVDPTCTTPGSYDNVVYCTVCETELSREPVTVPVGHYDKDGNLECDGCSAKLFKLATMNVAADARTELVLKFEVHKDLYDAAEADEKQAYENVVLVNFDNSKDTNATHTIDLEEETTDAGTKYYVIVTQPVASGLMTENVTVTFSDGDNSVYVLGTGDSSVSRNVVDYARAVLLSEGTSDAAKKLVAAMVNYGGYAQQFFALKNSTEPGTLASDLLSETGINAPEISAEKSLTSIDGTLVSGDLTVTQDPGLDAAISQRIFFALSNGASFTSESTTQVSVTLTYKRTRNGEEYTKTLYPKQENDGRYSVEILNIPAAFLDFGYKIEGVYYNSNGEEKTFVVYPSIASYMSRVYKNEGFTTTNKSDDADLAEARKNLMEAMWLYNQAAYDFFYPSNESEGS